MDKKSDTSCHSKEIAGNIPLVFTKFLGWEIFDESWTVLNNGRYCNSNDSPE